MGMSGDAAMQMQSWANVNQTSFRGIIHAYTRSRLEHRTSDGTEIRTLNSRALRIDG
jgi:hypothetical protein